MAEGRGIADAGWLQSSVDYNHYFMEHDNIDGVAYETLDVTGLSLDESVSRLESWLREKWNSL